MNLPEDSTEHYDALVWVNGLVVDLRLQLCEQGTVEPINLERLKEWDKHFNDLAKCRKRDVK